MQLHIMKNSIVATCGEPLKATRKNVKNKLRSKPRWERRNVKFTKHFGHFEVRMGCNEAF
jgi:hypothetical protein